MSNVIIDREKIDILANAISNKSGVPVTMTLDEMVEAVDNIELKPALQAKTYTVNSAGTATVTADSGYDGLSEVEVDVPNGVFGDVSWTSSTTSIQRKYTYYLPIKTAGFFGITSVMGTLSLGLETSTITPTESSQTITPSATNKYLNLVTVNAIPSNYVGSGITQRSSSDLTASGATVTVPAGYYPSAATKTIASGTQGTPSWNVTKSSSNFTTTVTYPNATAGYYSGIIGAGYSLELENKTVTPTTSQQVITPTSNNKYLDSVTVEPIASGTTGTPTATKGTVSNHSVSVTPSVTNTTGYITGSTINGTAVTVTASELVSGTLNITSNNTYDVTNYASAIVNVSGGGGGGGGVAKIGTATTTPSSASTSISFTGLLGEPTSFAIVSNSDLATGASPWKTAAVVFDGTSLHGQTIRNTSNAQVTYDGSGFTKTYNNGTLTVTGSGTNFQANQYKLVYTYDNTIIGTAETQVGSGATSITFTGITDQPAYFSCIFKSNFSTSSGYQRVIVVVNDGASTYGMEMDSSAKVSTAHWSYTYNNGSLTITSQGTNAGGYFHQPGYYQLTYGIGGEEEILLQDKSVTPSESQQLVTADEGYIGLGTVTVGAISSTYVGSGITQRSSTDLTTNGATVTVPSGYYASQATKSVTTMTLPTSAAASATSGYTSKATIGRSTAAQYINIPPGYNSTGAYYVISAVANGSATGPTSLSGTAATVSTGTNTLTLTKTGVTTTPTVSAGYVSSATASTATVTLTASVTTKAAATITPTTTNQTIASGTYLTGTQTIAGDADLIGSNIISTANIFGVQGTVVLQNIYTGSSAPSSSTGSNGDIYIQS